MKIFVFGTFLFVHLQHNRTVPEIQYDIRQKTL